MDLAVQGTDPSSHPLVHPNRGTEFKDDGRLAYVVPSDGKTQTMRMVIESREALRQSFGSTIQPAATRSTLPVDYLSDEEFDCEVLESLDQATTKISLRVPRDLLGRTKQAAERRGVPYQSLMKALIDQGIRHGD